MSTETRCETAADFMRSADDRGDDCHQNVKPVPIFVTSIGAANGFTDPSKDNQNTVKDLRNSLGGRKTIVLTNRREEAVIVLTVLGRRRARFTASAFGPGRDVELKVKFQAGEIESELSASALGGTATTGGAWSKAA